MTAEGGSGAAAEQPPGRPGRALRGLALGLVLFCLLGRCFLNELPFRTSALQGIQALRAGGTSSALGGDHGELARVSFAMVLLAAGGLWLLGGAVAGGTPMRFRWWAVLIALFALLSLVSALRSSDVRSALDCWVEQVAILSAGYLAAEICAEGLGFGWVVAVLAGAAAVMAAKGFWQVFVEVPQRVADFEMYRAQRLASFGWQADSVQAKLLEARLKDPSPFGYFSLANIFASLMIVLAAAAAGLAWEKLVAGWRHLRPRRGMLRDGQVPLPMLAAVLSLLVAIAAVVVLFLTRSRGGVAGFVLAGVLALVAGRYGRTLGRHWKKAALIAVGVFVLSVGLVVGVGLARDRLPTKTMTFRWYYWTGSARIVRDRPVLGVGPGNFASAYLKHRRAEGEEAIKLPHNVFVHAAVQYGLLGGGVYVAILVGLVLAASRPAAGRGDLPLGGVMAGGDGRFVLIGGMILATAPLLARTCFAGLGDSGAVLIFEAVLPAAVLAVGMLIALWGGGRLDGAVAACGVGSRVAIACGAVGFLVHNMVTYSLWVPATALVFWVAAGAAAGRAGGPAGRRLPRASWALGVAAVVLVCAAGWMLWRPVYRRDRLMVRIGQSIRQGHLATAEALAGRYAALDKLDAISASEAARVILAGCQGGDPAEIAERAGRAYEYARLATRRDPANFAHARLAGMACWLEVAPDAMRYRWEGQGPDDQAINRLTEALLERPGDVVLLSALAGVKYRMGEFLEALRLCELAIRQAPGSFVLHARAGDAAWRAGQREKAAVAWRRAAELAPTGAKVQEALSLLAEAVDHLNPMDLRLRVDYAEILLDANRPAEALRQLELAEAIDSARMAESLERFTPAERQDVAMLKARAEVLAGPKD